ncbi:MAG: OmpA family protein [Desulfobacterales bacterium]|nr:OmpA family protein [Desulfobacterales bacterium]
MKNVSIVVLALLVVAAIVSGFIFYGKYLDMKDTVGASNEKLSDLNEKVAQLQNENSLLKDQISESAQRLKELEDPRLPIAQLEDAIEAKDEAISGLDETVAQLREENARLSEQIGESAERLKELEGAKLRISQLEDEIKVKDHAFSRLDEKVRKLEEGSKEEKRIGESLRRELSSKDAMVAALRDKLRGAESVAKARIEELKSAYESLISQLKKQLKDKEMTIRKFEEKLSITFVDKILFDFGSARIRSEGRGILTRVGDSLKNVHGMKIRVVGHTDNRSIKGEYLWKFPSNWELSSARASAVARFLQEESGLDPESFEVVGRSFYEPVASNETKEGRAQNRRVEVIIAPKVEEQ